MRGAWGVWRTGESSVWLPFIPLNPSSSYQLLAVRLVSAPTLADLPTSSPTPSAVSPSHTDWGLSLWTRSRGAAVGEGGGAQSRSSVPRPLARGAVSPLSTPPVHPLSPSVPSPRSLPLLLHSGIGKEMEGRRRSSR